METIVFCTDIEAELTAGMGMENITDRLESLVSKSKVKDGILSAAVTGSTGSLTTIEHEPGVMEDLRRAVNKMAPPDIDYEHEKAWGDGNGHSHVQAAIMGPSLCMQIRDGKIQHGTWQQIVVINHDNRPRRRKIAVTITGRA